MRPGEGEVGCFAPRLAQGRRHLYANERNIRAGGNWRRCQGAGAFDVVGEGVNIAKEWWREGRWLLFHHDPLRFGTETNGGWFCCASAGRI